MRTICHCEDQSLQKKYDPIPGSDPKSLWIAEFVRWIAIVIPLFLSIWRFADLRDCYSFHQSQCPHNKSSDGSYQNPPNYGLFWGLVTFIIMAASISVYAPLKLLCLRWQVKHNKLKYHRWRPSILAFIIICALPSLLLIAFGASEKRQIPGSYLDATTTNVLQLLVGGLIVTEWSSKLREEHLSYDLLNAMSHDIFFAYEVIQFLLIIKYESGVFHSIWYYLCFSFAFVSMFSYVPAKPHDIHQPGALFGAAVVIIVSMICVDLPFFVIRLSTIILYGLEVGFISMLKNVCFFTFDAIQLWILSTHYSAKKKHEQDTNVEDDVDAELVPEERWSRYPVCVWDSELGAMVCTLQESGHRMSLQEPGGTSKYKSGCIHYENADIIISDANRNVVLNTN